MKTKFIFAALMGLAIVACQPKAGNGAAGANAADSLKVVEKTAADYLPSKAVKDSVSYLMGIQFGSILKGNDFGELNISQIVKGMKDFMNAKGTPKDSTYFDQFKINPQEKFNEMINSWLENRHHYNLLVNKEKGAEFLAKKLKESGVEKTESGLVYRIIEAGAEPKAAENDTVLVHYVLKDIEGNVIEEIKASEEAVPVVLRNPGSIEGWVEGLQLVGEGGKLDLYIPAELAYGEQGTPAFGPNSTLEFNIVVDQVKKYVAPVEK